MQISNVSGFGLIAVDKSAGRILFLDPATLEIRNVIDDLPPKPHELLILPQQGKAYVPIYGDGIHGDNPHPEHHIAVVDLARQQLIKLIDVSPFKGPHTARLGANGLIYCCCEESAAVVAIDPHSDTLVGHINVGSDNVHRLATIPGRNQLITENEEDRSLCQVDLNGTEGQVIKTLIVPGSVNGIDTSPIRPWVVATSSDAPELFVIDRNHLQLLDRVPIVGHRKGGQLVRFRSDGEVLAVIGDFEPVASFYDKDLNHLFTAQVQDKPLDGAFTPDGRYFLVANENSGSISVISLEEGRTVEHISVPEGCEVLAYYPLAPIYVASR